LVGSAEKKARFFPRELMALEGGKIFEKLESGGRKREKRVKNSSLGGGGG